jgi:sulfur carrier protein ThiS
MEMNSELTQQAATSNSTFQTTLNLVKAQNELNNRYGVTVKLNQESTRTYVELIKQAGLSAEAAGALYDTTVLTKKGFKETAEEQKGQVKILRATTGLMLNEKEIQEGIKNVSTATKLQLGGSVTAITNAVFQAKALGVELKTLESISSSLLNFQSSIEDELAAELLTGKQLNLEGARYAALIGDQAMLAEELAANFGTAADFQDMNVIQQEAMAKAVGLNRDSLAESLMKREAIAALSEFEGVNEKEKYENAVKLYGIDGARQRLGNEALADQMESVSMQERLIQAGEKFQQALIPLAETILPMIEKGFQFVDDHLGAILGSLSALISLALVFKGVSMAIAAIQIGAAFTMNPIKATLGAAAGIAAIATLGGAVGAVIGDGEFPANGRPKITTKEGEFYGSINDDVVVAPGAVAAMNNRNRNTGGSNQAINNNVTVSPSDTRIILNYNGQTIDNINATQNYKVGNTVKALGGRVDYSATV